MQLEYGAVMAAKAMRATGCVFAALAFVWSCGDGATTPAGDGGSGGAAGRGSGGKGGQPSAMGGSTAVAGHAALGGADAGGSGQAGAGAAGVVAEGGGREGGSAGEFTSSGAGGGAGLGGVSGGGAAGSSAAGGGGVSAAGGSGGAVGGGGAGGSGGFDIGGPFGHQPGTIQRTAMITKNDHVCVVIFSGGMCLAQNDPACNAGSPPASTALTLTLDAQGQLSVQAPYQDMCTSDYVGGVVDMSGNPLGVAVATSYAVPLDTTAYYAPRSIDHCRVNTNGADSIVKDQIKTWIEGTTLFISQLCTTQFTVIDPVHGVTPLTDTRSWTTKIQLQ